MVTLRSKLTAKGVLQKKGWKRFLEARKAREDGEGTYDSLVGIANAIFEAAFETKPGLKEENYLLPTGRRTTSDDDDGETTLSKVNVKVKAA
ncbi:hypothetical protein C0995_003596 [Termitomyces sp. Mi166|nr:hypothetical protein C0995_003596 [Termitomyces sp. Mi166\